MKLDLHVHSRHSRDAKGSVLELAEAAKTVGLDGFALTDHDTLAGQREITDASAATGMLIVPGVELDAAEGHVLCLGVDRMPEIGSSLADVVAQVDAWGGIAAPSHPLRGITGVGPMVLKHASPKLVACEARNARERPLVQENTERMVAGAGLVGIGGSDAHWIDDIGTAWTSFPADVRKVADVVAAIRAGNCSVGGASLPRRDVWRHRIGLVGNLLQRR